MFTRNKNPLTNISDPAFPKRSRLSKAALLACFLVFTCLFCLFCWQILENSYQGNHYPNSARVLSWWGYLDNVQQMAELEAKCNTEITVKNYMDVEELQDFASENYYDIYIYPWGYHKAIESHLPFEGPDLTALTTGYHPDILKQYYAHDMPKDSLFFQHASLSFVYDKRLVPDLTQLTIDAVFELASIGHVYLMDEIKHLNDLFEHPEESTALDNWIRLYQMIHSRLQWHQSSNTGFYFSNFTSKMLNRHLVLGVIDSGELINPHIDWSAVTRNNPDKHLEFGLHPKLSQVNSDIIAVKTHDEAAVCVAKAMGSREFLRQISRDNYYFSPFEDPIPGLAPATANIHQDFYKYTATMSWTDNKHHRFAPSPAAYTIFNIIRQCHQDANCDGWARAHNL